MTELTLASTLDAVPDADAVVIVATTGRNGAVPLPGTLPGVDLATALRAVAARGTEGEVTRIATLGVLPAPALLVSGAGDPKRLTAETLRRAVGAAVRGAAGMSHLAVVVPTPAGLTDGEVHRALAEGALLGSYDFTTYRFASNDGRPAPVARVTLVARGRTAATAVARAEIVAEGVRLVRDLVNTPPGDLFPAELAARATSAAEAAGLTVEVFDDKALAKGGYGGITGVGQGSARPPRLVRISYTNPRAKRTLALVGKGVTFDSGGLSLKPPNAMEDMKMDMAGSATVLATVIAAARLELKVNITAWMPIAENMPSGKAIRPGDVLTMYGGKKVEILNTDAEGRLILADAITRAAEEKPNFIVDIATLTGAALVALGTRTAGVMSNDDGLRERIVDAADTAGELMWPMPLPTELRKSIDSEVGDITNTGDRMGGMLVGGLFLQEFVPDGQRWAHIDFAGPAWNSGDAWAYTPKGGTGFAVRTLVQLAEDISKR